MGKDTGEILLAYESAKEGKIMLRKIFPAAFTLISLCLFMVPVYLAVYSARHPAVRYFHGQWYYMLIIIPIIILVVHFYHIRNGPNRYVTNLAMLVPSFLLLLYGTHLLTNATSAADRMFSTDCTTMREKMQLQREWEAAESLYSSCLKSTAVSRNLSSAYLAKNFRVQDCTEYESALASHRREWNFLQYLEENQACTGFCKPGAQLWSSGPHKDSCSVAVASVFRYVVRSNCLQVVVISLITLCCTMGVMLFL
jgi:hypothetical protein